MIGASGRSHCHYAGRLWDIRKSEHVVQYVNGHGEVEAEARSYIWYLYRDKTKVAHWWSEAEALAWMEGFCTAVAITPADSPDA